MSRLSLFSLSLIGLFLFVGNTWSQEESGFNIIHKGEKQILVEYTGDAETVEIPEGVTSIGDNAFSGCDSVTSIVIPKSVTKIGDNAFNDCKSLTSIVFPKSVKKIGEDLFDGCQNLTIYAPKGSKIEGYAKKNEIPFKVSSKKANISKNSKEEVVPVVVDEPQVANESAAETQAKVTPVEESGPVEEVIPEEEMAPAGEVPTETTVEDETKKDLPKINPADYPNFKIVQEEGKTILTKYTGYDKNVTIPEGVTEIGKEAFKGNYLASIVIPNGVTVIGMRAFYGCRSLTSVVIPESVNEIGDWAFEDCKSLTTVAIPKGMPTIGVDAFLGCAAPGKALLSVDGKFLLDVSNDISGEFIIPESVKVIGGGTFHFCSSLTSVVIPKGVKVIGKYAFWSCSALEAVTIPEGVTEIGMSAFSGCSSLTSIVIPEGVTEIGDGAFAGCSSLTSVVIPEGVTEIGDVTLSRCSSLTSVEIPEGVTEIGEWAFSGCSSLTSIVIPESTTVIKQDAFSECSALKGWTISFTHPYFKTDGIGLLTKDGKKLVVCLASAKEYQIPEGVTEIGEYAFSYCSSLTSVVIPKGVKVIGKYAFNYCKSLNSVVIPEGVTVIGEYTFKECKSLKSVVIPKGVTKIGFFAFGGCQSLTSIFIPQSVTQIENLFYSGSHSTTIYAPKGSAAEDYAKYNFIPFYVLAEDAFPAVETIQDKELTQSKQDEPGIDSQNIIDFNKTLEKAGFNINSSGVAAYLTYGTSDLLNRSQNADPFDKKTVEEEIRQWQNVNLRENIYKFSMPIIDVLVDDNYSEKGIAVRFYLPFFLQNFVNETNNIPTVVSFTTEGENLCLYYCLDKNFEHIGEKSNWKIDKKDDSSFASTARVMLTPFVTAKTDEGVLSQTKDIWNRLKFDEKGRDLCPFCYRPLVNQLWCVYTLKASEETLKDVARHKENYKIIISFDNFQISNLLTPNVLYPYTISTMKEFLNPNNTIPVSISPVYAELYPTYKKTGFPNCQLLSLEIQKNDGTVITTMKYKTPSSAHENFKPHWKQALDCKDWPVEEKNDSKD